MKFRIYKVIKNTVILGFIGILYYVFGKFTGLYIPCLFYKVTGLYCPGCGVTRMFYALSEGNIYQAFRSNEIVFILIPFLLFELILYVYKYIKADKRKTSKFHTILIYGILIVVILFGIIRNVPYFEYLKPITSV